MRSSFLMAGDLDFKAALSDIHSPIVQRRSGKTAGVGRSATPKRSAEQLFFRQPLMEPGGILESGKTMARALADSAAEDERLVFARSFCARLIETYWFESQRKYSDAWTLPEYGLRAFTSSLDETSVSLARTMGEAAAQLDPILASYLIGVTYTAMLPEDTRSRLGVYYTPPGLTSRLLDMATAAGVDWRSCRVIDPACGGGAFLAPVAARMVKENRHLTPVESVDSVGERLRGLEIDPFGAWASQVFLETTLMDVCRSACKRLPVVVEICNSLLRTVDPHDNYDLVIGNPPYGRVTLNSDMRSRYKRSLYGHANLYGLFTDLGIRLTRPGGVIAYVTPTSFLAGEYFKALRKLLTNDAAPVNLDFLSVRRGVFDDALQETLLATYKREGRQSVRIAVPQNHPGRECRRREGTVHFIAPLDCERIEVTSAGRFILPVTGDPWLIPRTPEQEKLVRVLQAMSHRLRDYGYKVSTGPLVWNRHKRQLSQHSGKGMLPLIWAECVAGNGLFVFRADKKNHQPYFKPETGDDWLICRDTCVLLQRTTAKEQTRRLIAAELPKKFLAQHGAVVVENHLNMIGPIKGRPPVSTRVLAAFLNTDIVDKAFRCLSGSVAVSAYELEALPLPAPESLARFAQLVKDAADQSEIEEACYRLFERE